MALTKVTKVGITNDAVDSDKLKDGSITTAKIGASAVESSEINDGTITVDDLASTLDLSSKTVTLPNTSVTVGMLSNTLDLSSKTVTLAGSTVAALKQPIQDNIGLLGFKMAVNDGLTVFNLVDGVVDEFHDESGTDEAEGSNDLYCGTSDYYINSTQPAGVSACVSAGFTTASITEPDTSVTGTDISPIAAGWPKGGACSPRGQSGCGSVGKFTVPSGVSSVSVYAWGAGGSKFNGCGGGGGYATGTLAVTAAQAFDIVVGEAGHPQTSICTPGSVGQGTPSLGGGGSGATSTPQGNLGSSGGGLSGIFGCNAIPSESLTSNGPSVSAPTVYLVVGGGGGGAHGGVNHGGGGGGLTGVNGAGSGGGGQGGSQCAAGSSPLSTPGPAAGFLRGGASGRNTSRSPATTTGAGGSGYYGGGAGGASGPSTAGGGGGSSYIGHPQITSGSTEAGGTQEGGGDAVPLYTAPLSDSGMNLGGPRGATDGGGDGYVLFTASLPATTTSTTITSNAFASGTVPTSSRIVVFEENVETPTLNTDIIASVSRDAGVTFTTATLADSGYVTGSSGQRILVGQATISGQPSGQSMRWKLVLANNAVKIHGVSLQWS